LTGERSFYDCAGLVIRVAAFLFLILLIWSGWKQPYGPQAKAFFGKLPDWMERGLAPNSAKGLNRP
jgi:hypothetical protein